VSDRVAAVFARVGSADRRAVGAAAAVLVAGIAVYWPLRNQPFYWDAGGYVDAARGISDHGLLSEWPNSDRRSYGYPLFLAAALGLAGRLHIGDTTGIFLLQWPLFVGAAALAACALFTARTTRLLAFTAVAANPLLVVYAPQAFTESLTLTLVLLATAALGRAAAAARGRTAGAWLAGGAAATSYAVVVRPGSVLVPVCFALAAGVVLWRLRGMAGTPVTAVTGVLVLVALVVPLVPQSVINHRHYDSVSPLPTYDLAGIQAFYGMKLARYATNVSTCGVPQLEFPNPARPVIPADVTTGDALRYYTTTWPDGPALMALHVFSGLDPRPFLVDQRAFGGWYSRPFQAVTVALLFLAGAGLARAARRIRAAGRSVGAEIAFMGVVAATFVAVLATSAAEYRFGAVPLVVISLLAALGAAHWRPERRTLAFAAGAYAGVLLLWIAFSDLLLSTSPVWRQCG
jgi:hypothetical protein